MVIIKFYGINRFAAGENVTFIDYEQNDLEIAKAKFKEAYKFHFESGGSIEEIIILNAVNKSNKRVDMLWQLKASAAEYY